MFREIIEIILHTDDALLAIVSQNVTEAYIILFLFVMLETGVIFFPFLPGDGLLFSAGVIAASSSLNVWVLYILLIIAAVTGNLINYYVGRYLGFEIRRSRNYFIQNHIMKHMPRVEEFYRKYGGGAVIIGRFFPVIRTYIPFLAGIVKMRRSVFLNYTAIGALAWISVFLLTGFFVGEIPWVKENFGLIFLSLIIITLIPFFYKITVELIRQRKERKNRVSL